MTKKDSSTTKNGRVVTITAPAFLSMSMHSMTHATDSVHGVLMGTFENDGDVVKISDAVPICHGPPTGPLVETALGLVQKLYDKMSIVGWYTAPELLNDDRPGPVALRIVANLAVAEDDEKNKDEPVLLVINNQALGKCISAAKQKTTTIPDEKEETEEVFKALGKDFGQQWLEPLSVQYTGDKVDTIQAMKDAYVRNVKVNDFVDHLDSPDSNASWYHSNSLFSALGFNEVEEVDPNYGK